MSNRNNAKQVFESEKQQLFDLAVEFSKMFRREEPLTVSAWFYAKSLKDSVTKMSQSVAGFWSDFPYQINIQSSVLGSVSIQEVKTGEVRILKFDDNSYQNTPSRWLEQYNEQCFMVETEVEVVPSWRMDKVEVPCFVEVYFENEGFFIENIEITRIHTVGGEIPTDRLDADEFRNEVENRIRFLYENDLLPEG